MRPSLNLRKTRLASVGVGASMLAIPAAAAALGSTPATGTTTTTETTNAIALGHLPHELGYGDRLTVSGAAQPADAGESVMLQFTPTGGSNWVTLSTAMIGASGQFRLRAPMHKSGLVRVLGSALTTPVIPATAGEGAATTGSPAALAPSAPWHVSVSADVNVNTNDVTVLAGQAIDVHGKVLPIRPGRRVFLQGLTDGHWTSLTSTRSGLRGQFDLHYVPTQLGGERLRVQFAGDKLNAKVNTPAGSVTVFQDDVASWYYDGGQTACGFHAYYGVANRSLPCGTQVTFHYGGNTVTATVDDRGPFVGGRNWDLNQNTAAALGFSGVATVWTTL